MSERSSLLGLPRRPMTASRGITRLVLLLWVLLPVLECAPPEYLPSRVEGSFQAERIQVQDANASLIPIWGDTWQMNLHAQLDGLFATLKGLPSSVEATTTPHLQMTQDEGFKISMIGDSTMVMQAVFLWDMLLQRRRSDGTPQCYVPEKIQGVAAKVRCLSESHGDGQPNSDQPHHEHAVLTVELIRVHYLQLRKFGDLDANFVYFGCGLHLLQFIPYREILLEHMQMWAQYEGFLEETVRFIRAGDVSKGRRIPIEVMFMATHSISEDRFADDYQTGAAMCGQPDSTMLAQCLQLVRDFITADGYQTQEGAEYDISDMCTKGCFTDSGVVDLNRRAEKVMNELGVPILPAYDITRGQSWATAMRDGRHYQLLVPVELGHFISHITSTLRATQHNLVDK